MEPLGSAVQPPSSHGIDGFGPKEPFQIIGKLLCGRIPGFGILLQAALNDPGQVPGQFGQPLTQRHRGCMQNGIQELRERVDLEGDHTSQQHVEHDAEPIDIRATAQAADVPSQLLGAGVRWRAHGAPPGGIGRFASHHPEIADNGMLGALLTRLDQDIVQLQVQVDQSLLVGSMHTKRHVADDPELVLEAQRGGQVRQGRSLHQLHDDEALSDLIDPADVGVFHPGLGPRFHETGAAGILQDLDGHLALQQRIQGPVHASRGPFTQEGEIPVSVSHPREIADGGRTGKEGIQPGTGLAPYGIPGQGVQHLLRHLARIDQGC